MPQDEAPQGDSAQIYLVTPARMIWPEFSDTLAAALDAVDIACLRLSDTGEDADTLARTADGLRELAHARDIPLVIETHLVLAERLGLDGVHLTDGTKGVRPAREALGADGIVGIHADNSRHDGLVAGDAGADYVTFGPVADRGLGEPLADTDLFAWWTEMIEVPVVAEGALLDTSNPSLTRLQTFAPIVDFVSLGDDLWAQDDPIAVLRAVSAALTA